MYCPISEEYSERYSSALKMKAKYSSDKSVNFLPDYMASRPRRSDIHSHCHETLRSYKKASLWCANKYLNKSALVEVPSSDSGQGISFCPLIFIVCFSQCSKCWDSKVRWATYASCQMFIPSCFTICAVQSETLKTSTRKYMISKFAVPD